MPSPVSVDLRWRVVSEYEVGDESFKDLGLRFEVGEASLNRWVQPKPVARTLKGAFLLVALGACRTVNLGSNAIGGGRCDGPQGGSSAALTGAAAFPIISATEAQLAWQAAVYDGGAIVGWGDAGQPFIQLSMLGAPAPWPFSDAGGCANAIRATISGPADAGSWSGVYGLGDGGSATLQVGVVDDQGTFWLDAVGTQGELRVDTAADCALSGGFFVVLAHLQADATSDAGWGWTDGGPLSGTFHAVYDVSAGNEGAASTSLDVAPLRGSVGE